MRRVSSARTSSSALFILATMWNRSRICSASGTFLLDDLQIRLPHVRADEGDLGDDFLAHGSEESLDGVDGSFSPDPEQAGDSDVDLIDQRQILVALGVLDFIHADGV